MIFGVVVKATLSVVSVAAIVTDSATVSVTVKVVFPLASVPPGVGPVTTAVEDDGVKVTAFAETGRPVESSSVTVTVDWSTPSAVTVVGDATTVDLLADTVCGVGADPSPAGVPPSLALGDT